jgi:hypothetical protein
MTLITFEDGKPLMKEDGKVGTEQECCCCRCEDCADEYDVTVQITGRVGGQITKTFRVTAPFFFETFGDQNGAVGERFGFIQFECNPGTILTVLVSESEVEQFGTNQIYQAAIQWTCGPGNDVNPGEWFQSLSGDLEPEERNGQISTRFIFQYERLLTSQECRGSIPRLDTDNMANLSCNAEAGGTPLNPCPVRIVATVRAVP